VRVRSEAGDSSSGRPCSGCSRTCGSTPMRVDISDKQQQQQAAGGDTIMLDADTDAAADVSDVACAHFRA